MANWSTDSIFRSECSEKLEANQGADVIIRRVLGWNACIVRIWDGFAQPQIWIAYAHIGCKGDLYIISFVCALVFLTLKSDEVGEGGC